MQTNIFTPKVDQIFDDPKRKFARGRKLSFLRNDPRLPFFMSLMLKNSWYFQNMQNIAVFRKVANMSTFCISAQYVRVSLREP